MQVHEPLLTVEQGGGGTAMMWIGKINELASTLTLNADGSFQLVSDKPTPRGLFACFPSNNPITTATADEVVGATLNKNSIQIWYMPISNPKSDRHVRRLRKTPPLQLADAHTAAAVVAAVQASISSPCRRVLAIINPVSGRGTAPKLYKRHVRPVLSAAGFSITEQLTTHRGHATELIKSISPSEIDLILSIGGDGTTFEVLQGLLQRPDWDIARKIPIIQIPGGSGNALAANTQLWNAATAAHAAVKGVTLPLDIVSVVQSPGQRVFSFLSITFGMISCMDIGTENLRWMGGLRVVVGGVKEIFMQPTYGIKLAYLDVTGGGGGVEQQQQYSQQQQDNKENGGGDGDTRPITTTSDNSSQWLSVLGDGPPLRHFSDFSAVPAARTSIASPSHSLEPTETDLESNAPSPHPALPPHWHWMPVEEVQLFAACNLANLDMNFKVAPAALPSDGRLNLIYTAGRAGRRKGLEILNAAGNGQHLHLVQQHEVKGLWLEPLAEAGSTWLVVDGEEVAYRPLYAEVHPGLCTVLRPPQKLRHGEMSS